MQCPNVVATAPIAYKNQSFSHTLDWCSKQCYETKIRTNINFTKSEKKAWY